MGHNNFNNDNDGNNDNDDNGKDDDDDDDASVPPKMRPFFDLIRGFFPGLTFIPCSSKNLVLKKNHFLFFHSRVASLKIGLFQFESKQSRR